jgi:hypothetical protein
MGHMESMARFTKPSTIVSDGELKLSLYEKPVIGLRFSDLLRNGSQIEFRNCTLALNSKNILV